MPVLLRVLIFSASVFMIPPLMNGSRNRLGILSLQFYSYPDEIGGAWKFTYEANKRLVERGHQVFLITCKPSDNLPDHEVIEGVHYYRIRVKESKSVFGMWSAFARIFRTIRRRHPLHLAHVHNPLVGFIALLHPRFWRIPKIYHFHSLWYDEELINRRAATPPETRDSLPFRLKLLFLSNLIRGIEWTCYATARSVLFLSQYSRDKFKTFYPFKKSGLRVIPGGVDLAEFCPAESDESVLKIKQRLALPENRPILLTVRRLAARMGLENLLSACAMIARRLPEYDFFLVIVGKGSLENKLKSLVEEYKLQDKVRLTGPVMGEELPLYYKAADLFVLPSTQIEGFGLATVEALACGLPAIGTPVGGTVEILNRIDGRLLFESALPEALADHIEEYLKNPLPLQQLKTRCREETVSRYSWETVVDRLEEEFYLHAKAGD